MTKKSEVFEDNYQHYCQQIAGLDFPGLVEPLGISLTGERFTIPFYGHNYQVTGNDILDESGARADYMACVVLAKYLLLAPAIPRLDPEWASFQDLRTNSQFTNTTFLVSETERPLLECFSGRVKDLEAACLRLGGVGVDIGSNHDLSMEFTALPRISLLLLFNDSDEEFPATCSILCQRQAEFYLDPESLIITAVWLTKQLCAA